MTESESVALPLGDTPLTNAIITYATWIVKAFLEKICPSFRFFRRKFGPVPNVRRGSVWFFESFFFFLIFSVEILKDL